MKRAAEVKPSVRCSEEPVAGDGSMCAVSITKRAKLEEPEAADGITRRSPKLLAADGAIGITTKRPRKPEKPPKKNKRFKEEKNKRSKEEKNKRSKEEKNKRHKQPNQVEVVKHVSMEEQVMTELAEKSKNKKLVTHEINQAEMGPFLSKEVWSYVMSIGVVTFEDCIIYDIGVVRDPDAEYIRYASRIRRIENQAKLLRQYRTNGHAVLQYEVTDDERDAEV